MRFLGLDSSTQSLTALLVDTDTGEVIDRSVAFGARLPQYKSPSGFLAHPDPRVKHSDPLMWVEALDLLLGELRESGVDLSTIRGVSGAGQQHGSVYLERSIDEAGHWDLSAPLVDQVRPLLSRKTAPIWMDASTGAECAEITKAAGGPDRMVALTGTIAIERFTGPQIRKYWKDDPAGYEATAEIHLVSSFVASLLTGTSVPIDLGDGAGMNLLELATDAWSPMLLDATAPGLGRKLKRPVPGATYAGTVADYFVKRYGFAPNTPVIAFTGDNPSSLVGMGATEPGTAVVSLGTSDTMFAAMPAPRTDPKGYGNVFGNPAGGFMALCCFSNGSLAREAVAKRVNLGWDDFARAILERTPRLPAPAERWFGSPDFVAGKDAAAAARAVVEAQALSMRIHSAFIGQPPARILVTGGASKNPGILRVLADVFQAEIVPLRVANSSALGGALRSAQAIEGLPWSDLYARFAAPDLDRRVAPDPGSKVTYEGLSTQLQDRLKQLLAETLSTR